MHEKGAPVLYGPRISFIMLSLPSTSVATSSTFFVFVPALIVLSVEVGGVAFCFEKASMSDFESGMGDRDLDLT